MISHINIKNGLQVSLPQASHKDNNIGLYTILLPIKLNHWDFAEITADDSPRKSIRIV
nr:MAG TPA: hypothetical protein [Caudoviricetes sp.]